MCGCDMYKVRCVAVKGEIRGHTMYIRMYIIRNYMAWLAT